MKNILIFGHDGSRTGASIMIYHFTNWVNKNTNAKVSLILLKGGELEKDFQESATCYIWNKVYVRNKIINSLLCFINRLFILFIIRIFPPNIVILNTVKSHFFLRRFSFLQSFSTIISFIHENEYSLTTLYSNYMSNYYLSKIDVFVAASIYTRNNLINNYNIPINNTYVSYEFIDPSFIGGNFEKKFLKEKGDFLVVACGVTSWRKGVDIFWEVAKMVLLESNGKGISFLWVGEFKHDFKAKLDYESVRFKYANRIHFIGGTVNPFFYIEQSDLFFLSSREDPFPLVALEAMYLGKPLICFKDSGGIPELILNGGGYILDYSNLESVKKLILSLLKKPEELAQKGIEGKILSNDFLVENAAPKLYKLILNIHESFKN